MLMTCKVKLRKNEPYNLVSILENLQFLKVISFFTSSNYLAGEMQEKSLRLLQTAKLFYNFLKSRNDDAKHTTLQGHIFSIFKVSCSRSY